MTNRLWPEGKTLVRVIIDKVLELSGENKIFDESAPTLILNSLKIKRRSSEYLKLKVIFFKTPCWYWLKRNSLRFS
ncbi:MAG: hypothetical protein IPH28_23225 [Cytophagaceae bacterium]|nr:hypothetical protein [Cytophagaceae bacterium]